MIKGDSQTLLIEMVEGDWGEELPLKISSDIEISENDEFVFNIFKSKESKEPIINKHYINITDKIIHFKLTKEETDKLKVGTYFYNIDWTQENVFLINIVNSKMFKVIDKVGV